MDPESEATNKDSFSQAAARLRELQEATKRLDDAVEKQRELSDARTENECIFYCRSCTNTFTRWLAVIPNKARCKCGSERTVLIGLDKVPY